MLLEGVIAGIKPGIFVEYLKVAIPDVDLFEEVIESFTRSSRYFGIAIILPFNIMVPRNNEKLRIVFNSGLYNTLQDQKASFKIPLLITGGKISCKNKKIYRCDLV